jgi:predicted extracellular nuclease
MPGTGSISLINVDVAATQDFDTLDNVTATASAASPLPTGWYFSEVGTAANATYGVNDGSSTSGNTFSYGTSGSTDRAFGTLLSGSLTSTIGAQFTNNTQATLASLDIAYTGEEWRLGAAGRADQLTFQISTNATGLADTAANWATVTGLNFVTPDQATPGAKNGNAATEQALLAATVDLAALFPGQAIATGSSFWIRWIDVNASGSDDGLAIDNFSITPHAAGAPAALPMLSINNPTVTEGNSGTTLLTYTVTASAVSTSDITFHYSTTDGTATAGSDYVSTSGTGTIVAGTTSATVTVTVNADTAVEPNETVLVTIDTPTNATATNVQGTGTINNDDNAGTFTLAGGVSQGEAAGAQTFTVNRTGGTAGAATVSFAVSGSGDHPADANDFTGGALPAGTVTFADGETSHTIVLPVANDTAPESDETYTLTLSGTTAGAIGTAASATGTIVNDDATPANLSIGAAQVLEGDSGTSSLTFTVTADAPAPAGGISFTIATADGTAVAGSDYVAQSATGTIAAGATSTTFTVVVNGDTDFEPNQTVIVTLSNPVNAVIVQGQVTGTIENDDRVPAGATAAIFATDFAQFTASGFAPGAAAASGMLDSNVWRIVGLSDNTNPSYGFTGAAGGDFGRGIINGAADPASAGVYSPSADHALIIQPTGAELDTNGIIEARIQNTSGATATSFDVAFDWAYRNSAARVDNLQLSFSTDGVNFTGVPAASFSTPGTAATPAPSAFADQHETVNVEGTVADGGYLYLRWIHASSTGGGSRDEVGIDNVNVVAHLSDTVTASIGNVTLAEGNGATTAVFTVTRSNGAGAASIDYATADGTATAGSDYVAQHGTVSFAAGELSKTISIAVNGDLRHESDETFALNLSNASGFEVPQTTATATITNDDNGPVAIYDIQGLGHRSPFTGQSVDTSGVVTSVRNNGFYLQDATGDGNVGTSDAIFVVTSGAPTVAVGNAITLTGTVAEYAAATNALSTTQLTNAANIVVTSAVATLPDAVLIATDGTGRAPPTQVIEDDGFRSFDPTTDGVDFYESLEGMRVTIKQPLVVANTDGNGQTFVVASGGANATGLNGRYGMTISDGDNNPETLKIYQGSSAAGAHSQGDVLNDVTGVVSYFGGRYEVDPTSSVTVNVDRAPLVREQTTLVGDADHLSYASFNIENFSPRDADYDAPLTAQIKVDRLAAEIIGALHNPYVIGLQEVQDNDGEGTGSDLSGAQNAQRLIDAIAAAGGPVYKYVEVAPTATNVSGGAPDGNIRNGFLFDPTHVTYVDGSVRVLTDAAFNGTRKPLVADFVFNGQTFTAIDTHSTSRGGSDPLFGTNQPPIAAGDAARTAQASAIKGYIDGVLANDADHKFVVNGDFNGFPYETALQTLANGAQITNLYDKLPVEERYSYFFDGYYQAFDNILVSSSLSANTSFDIVHYNAGFTDGLSVTDHDQAVAQIGLARGAGPATAIADSYATTAAAVLHGSVLANDTGGGGTLTVAAIDGDAADVGTAYRLASGALITLDASGVFAYDTDGAFAGLGSGQTATDSFSYALAGGSTATATITVTGLATPAPDAGGMVHGTAGDDSYGGTPNGDYFDFSAGGNDRIAGGAGDDAFYFGAAFTAMDHVNGGSGTDDQVGLEGDYTGAHALVLSATTLDNVEVLAALPGYSYDITGNDAMVGPGDTFTVFGGNLGASDNLTFNGASETDGSFMIYGGLGTDTLTGGAGADGFYFGPGKFGANDVVHGGGGANDQLGLDGNYTLTLDARADVETVALLRGPDGDLDHYSITVTDDFMGTAAGKTIFGFSVDTAMTVDASSVTRGNLTVYGGHAGDTITGGAGDDLIFGGTGTDTLAGKAGADTFLFDGAAQSTGTGFDTLSDFDVSTDKIRIEGQVHDTYDSVTGGTLNAATFDQDLQAAVGSHLTAGTAVFFTPDAGSFAGQTFLVVDADGANGYQAGGDYVFHMAAQPAPTPTPVDFIIA